jgi:hypothetical protein
MVDSSGESWDDGSVEPGVDPDRPWPFLFLFLNILKG